MPPAPMVGAVFVVIVRLELVILGPINLIGQDVIVSLVRTPIAIIMVPAATMKTAITFVLATPVTTVGSVR